MSAEAEARLQEKKDKVMSKQPKVSSTSVLIIAIVLIMIGGGVFLSLGQATDRPRPRKKITRTVVSQPLQIYTQRRVDMTKIKLTDEGDYLTVPLEPVRKYRMVRFEYNKVSVRQRNFAGRSALPLIAYVLPSGQLFVGVSYCEPCRSTTFHTETDFTLTCNICNTKWNLETLTALSGACMPYPPDELKAQVREGKIWIEKTAVSSWQPRVKV